MKLSTLLIALLLTIQAAGQPVQKVEQLLKEKKFIPLRKYVDSLPKGGRGIRWECLRNIVGDYQEAVIKTEEFMPARDVAGGSVIYNYSISLLASKETIFYYKYTVVWSEGPDHSRQCERLIDKFTDSSSYADFENAFNETYKATLNTDDLFLTSIVYGDDCGFAGQPTKYSAKLSLLLENEDTGELRRWLKSANAEKQLYAIGGYKLLASKGYRLTDEEKRILTIVKQKEGTVSTCSGCSYGEETFQDVVRNIESRHLLFLMPSEQKRFFEHLIMVTILWALSILGSATLLSIVIVSIQRREKELRQ